MAKYDHAAIRKAYPGKVLFIQDDNGIFEVDAETGENPRVFSVDQSLIDAARVDLNKLDYQTDRARAYPEIKEQLDMQYHDSVNGTTTWKDAISKVKSDYPKSS